MIAALYVETGGVYFGLDNVDPWDVRRDARLYSGPHSVVAHPPCSAWSKLAPIIQARYGHPIGADGGCFAAALAAVRAFGGVLEHPAGSRAWERFDLPKPRGPGWQRSLFDACWVCEVSQCAYGHEAEKLTWLFYVGDVPPVELDWSRPAPTATVSNLTNHGDSGLPRLTKKAAARTPLPFRDMLIRIAESARGRACLCGSGSPGDYEGPLRDCPVHGEAA